MPSIARPLLIVGMLAGAVAAAAGVAWTVVAEPAAVWSPEQAAEFEAATDAAHAAISGDGGSPGTGGAADPRPIEAARARLDRITAELERARSAHDNWGRWAAASGLALTVACGLGYLALQRR